MAGQPAPRIRLSRASTSVSGDDHQTYERADVTATEEELWTAMTPEHLMMLRRHFIQPRGWPGRASLSVSGEDEEETRLLTRAQFIDAVTGLLDTERYEGACGLIFDAIAATMTTSASMMTTSSGPVGTHISSSSSNLSSSSSSYGGSNSTLGISWGGLITYLATGVGARGHDVSQEKLFTPTPKYILLTHNKREAIAGVSVCGRKKLLIVGARGIISKTMQRVRQQSHHQCGRIHLDSTPDEEPKGTTNTTRKTNLGTWIVEVAMVEEEMAVMAASSSTLHFVDTSSAVPGEILRIKNLPNLPSCIAAGCENEGRWIVIGDDIGDAYLIRFSQPVNSLLTRSRSEGLTILTWQEMCAGYQEINGRMKEICVGVRVVGVPDLHNGSIRQILYHPPSSSLVSCSTDPKASLVIRAPDHNTKTYTFVIPKGVRAFAAEWQLHIVVTGSSDGRLRVWNPYLPAAPLSVLPPSPNRAPLAAVLIWSQKRVIVACDADSVSILVSKRDLKQVIRFYGLEGGRCLQTIQLKFPGGTTGLALRPLTLLQSGRIIIACRDYLATISPVPLTKSSSQQTHATDFTSLHSELLSDAESDIGEGKITSHVLVDDDDEEEDDEEEEEGQEDKMLKDSTLLSAHEKRECMRMRRLVRQGATFCCLKLCNVSPPNIPLDLPLPPRLANLGLTASDPVALLAHLPVPATSNAASMQTPRSAPASARSASARLASARSRSLAGRPSSAQKSASSRLPKSAALTDNHSEVLGSRKHLSPGWRPQQSTMK